MNLLQVFGFAFLLVLGARAIEHESIYVFEFGADYGALIDIRNGEIPKTNYHKEVEIRAPPNINITYVEVTIKSTAEPTVEYDSVNHKVSIDFFALPQQPSHYKVLAKGV